MAKRTIEAGSIGIIDPEEDGTPLNPSAAHRVDINFMRSVFDSGARIIARREIPHPNEKDRRRIRAELVARAMKPLFPTPRTPAASH